MKLFKHALAKEIDSLLRMSTIVTITPHGAVTRKTSASLYEPPNSFLIQGGKQDAL